MNVKQEIQVKQEAGITNWLARSLTENSNKPLSVPILKEEEEVVMKDALSSQVGSLAVLPFIKEEQIEEEKKENLVKYNPRRSDDIIPDMDELNFYCRSCEIYSRDKIAYRKHIKKVHKLIAPPLPKPARRLRPDIVPDVDDPNWHCKSCDRFYTNHDIYLSKRLALPITYNPNIQPDLEDPSNFCRSCNKTMKNYNNYRRHLIVVHKSHQKKN